MLAAILVFLLAAGGIAAAALLLALFVSVAALGFVLAGVVDLREDRTLASGPVYHFTGHCHLCGRAMLQTGTVWICAICDRAPIHHLVGRHRGTRWD